MSDRGSILPLIAGLLAFTLSAVMAVASVTSLSLERHRLVALAESTALAAADHFDPSRITRSGGEIQAPLASNSVREAAVEYLSGVATRLDALRLIAADSPDGRRARIVLSATWSAPIVSEFVSVSVPLRAEAWARSVIR